jgi:hypothetical protein
VIFIMTLSFPFSVSGKCAWMNALGISANITSLLSLASMTDDSRMPSRDAFGDAASSFDNHSLVGFPLYTSLPLILPSRVYVRNKRDCIARFFGSRHFGTINRIETVPIV